MAIDNVKRLRAEDLSPEHAPLTRLALAHAPALGANRTPFPDLVLYRFDHPTPFHKLTTHGVMLGVLLQGKKHVKVSDLTIHVDAHHFVVVTRDVAQQSAVEAATPEQPYLGISLGFSAEQVARALLTLREAGAPGPANADADALVMPFDGRVVSALHRLLLSLDDPMDLALYAPLATEEILLRLLRSEVARPMRSAVGREADADKILLAMTFAREHLAEPLSVERLANVVAMSPSHFAHRFRDVARTSPMSYVRELRLGRSRELLANPSRRVSEVALTLGYESASHFSRDFTRRFGVSPGRFSRGLKGT